MFAVNAGKKRFKQKLFDSDEKERKSIHRYQLADASSLMT